MSTDKSVHLRSAEPDLLLQLIEERDYARERVELRDEAIGRLQRYLKELCVYLEHVLEAVEYGTTPRLGWRAAALPDAWLQAASTLLAECQRESAPAALLAQRVPARAQSLEGGTAVAIVRDRHDDRTEAPL